MCFNYVKSYDDRSNSWFPPLPILQIVNLQSSHQLFPIICANMKKMERVVNLKNISILVKRPCRSTQFTKEILRDLLLTFHHKVTVSSLWRISKCLIYTKQIVKQISKQIQKHWYRSTFPEIHLQSLLQIYMNFLLYAFSFLFSHCRIKMIIRTFKQDKNIGLKYINKLKTCIQCRCIYCAYM